MTNPALDSARLRSLAQAATPGPWRIESRWTGEHSGADVVFGSTGQVICQCDEHDGGYGGGERNVEYIAALSPDVTLRLLDRIAELERIVHPLLTCDCGLPLSRPEPLCRMCDNDE